MYCVRGRRCIVLMFLNQKENIKAYCKTIEKFDTALPFAVFVGHNHWLIATSQPLQFSIVCHYNSVTSVQMNPPVGILHVKTSCVASNGLLSLISPFDGRSKYQLKDIMSEFMKFEFDKIPLNLWRPLQTPFPNITKIEIPEKLRDIKLIPMGALIPELNKVGPLQNLNKGLPSWVYFLIAVIVASAIIAGVILCYKYKDRLKRYWLAKGDSNGKSRTWWP